MKIHKDKKLNDFVNKIHDKYRNILGLQLWHGELFICNEDKKDTSDKNVAAEIVQNQNYLSYKITFYEAFKECYQRKDYKYCEQIIVHELCHVITEPLYELAVESCPPAQIMNIEKERERLTEILSKFVYTK